MVRYRHMDFELARFIMIKSILSPSQLYLHTKRSKQIKNQWHRDDPCLTSSNVALLAFCALIVCLSDPRGFSLDSLILEWLMTSICFIVFHFFLWGIAMSALMRFVAHKYLKPKDDANKMHGPQGGHQVEPMYAFDVHCNGFFPIILFFYFGNVSDNSALVILIIVVCRRCSNFSVWISFQRLTQSLQCHLLAPF